jgi:hypothetical protein
MLALTAELRCKRSASIRLPQRCNRVPPKCIIEVAHNPEVAGSNPAPATAKGPGNGAFSLVI